MSATLINTSTIPYRDMVFMVYFKTMKSIRYRLASGYHNIVEMSVPASLSEDDVRRYIEQIYPSVLKMQQKQLQNADKEVTRPDSATYSAWCDRLDTLIRGVQREMQLQARRYSLRYMRSRWGSCKPATKSITVNIVLASLPIECTHYLLVHELSHLVHPNHTPQFWQHVERYFPDYRRVRAFLRTRTIVM